MKDLNIPEYLYLKVYVSLQRKVVGRRSYQNSEAAVVGNEILGFDVIVGECVFVKVNGYGF